MLSCERCGYETELKCNLMNHLNRKKECKTLLTDISRENLIDKLKFKEYNENASHCTYCDKKFNTKSSMYRHLNICKKKPNDKEKIKNLEERLKNLEAFLACKSI